MRCADSSSGIGAQVHFQAAASLARVFVLGTLLLSATTSESCAETVVPEQPHPDERQLWQMLSGKDYQGLSASIARFRKTFPKWTPPKELIDLLHPGTLERDITRAIESGDSPALINFASSHSEAFGCKRIDWSWALGNAYAESGLKDKAADLAHALVRTCQNPEHRLVTLYKAKDWISASSWRNLLQIEAPQERPPEINSKFKRLLYESRTEEFLQALQAKSPSAPRLFAELAAEVEVQRDTGAALSAGWMYLDGKNMAAARTWFVKAHEWDPNSTDALRGLYYCALHQKKYDEALSLASALPAESEPERSSLIQQALIEKAVSQEYQDALALLTEADKLGPLPRHARTFAAWAKLNTGDATTAMDDFTQLYSESPDEESAKGMILSYRRAGHPDALEALAVSEPLASEFLHDKASRAFDEKHFLVARKLDATEYMADGSVGKTHTGLYWGKRTKTWDAGPLKNFVVRTFPAVEAGGGVGDSDEIHFRLDEVKLASDGRAGETIPGYVIKSDDRFHTSDKVQRFYWRHEGAAVWDVDLGRYDNTFSTAYFGRMTLHQQPSWGQASLSAYIEPVGDSPLSLVGWEINGEKSGRVRAQGIEVRALDMSAWPFSISSHFRLEKLKGEQVKDNDRFQGDLSLGLDLQLDGFQYAVASVYGSADFYRRDLSYYSLGHGGYFSPMRYLQGGIAFDFLTMERQSWIMRGHLNTGKVNKVLRDADYFPLHPDGQIYPGSSSHGSETNLELSAVARISNNLQAGALFSYEDSPQYTSRFSGLFLRILFEPSRSVLSADLPSRFMRDHNF
jgi:cellulose synthase operon protein C